MNLRLTPTAALLAAALALGACGGGDSTTGGAGTPPEMPPEPPPEMPPEMPEPPSAADPRVARLVDLLERADALLLTGLHSRWSLSAEGEPAIADSFVEAVSCSGARCVAADGTATTTRDLLGPSGDGVDLEAVEASLGARGGFDTVTVSDTFEVSETLPELTLTASPEVASYGFWGEHGFAALAVGAGRLSGAVEGTAYDGDFSTAQAWAAGDATGTNPAGTGSATWTGIAEASPTGTFARLTGTATVTIADLSRPSVDVGIDLDEGGVDRPLRWTDMPLADGGFAAGTAGTDYLRGNFHGPAHEEAWGAFDTADYIGAFGAKRTP